jgi:hypothetical protein
MWRCPHCQTPQPESSRCWVCKRSSTSCGTCKQFRRAIAGQFGYCAQDRHRLPLIGDEIRGCWEGIAPAATSPAFQPSDLVDPSNRIDFIPVGEPAPAPTPVLAVLPRTTAATPDEMRSGLWED